MGQHSLCGASEALTVHEQPVGVAVDCGEEQAFAQSRSRVSAIRFGLRTRGDTLRWGEVLGSQLRAGDVVALVGDLGAGKTTLTQGIALGLGIRDAVTSPTYTLVQEYKGRTQLFHIDPYRLNGPEDLSDIGFDEYLERGGVMVVEWADRVEDLLPEERLTILLEPEGPVGSYRSPPNGRQEPGSPSVADGTAVGELAGEGERRLLTVLATGCRYQELMKAMLARPDIAALLAIESAP
jgi:tRNA threonylcarbamoyladenosine biosynthesis protein TsaE